MIIPQTSDYFDRIVEAVSGGGVIAFRTDTFYGLGADPFNVSAVQRIKELKGRDEGKPILVVLSERPNVSRFIDRPSHAFELLSEKFWPGPLTLIGRAKQSVPPEITAGTESIGVRLPADKDVQTLIELCGGALTATSANLANQPAAKNADEVYAQFADSIDLIVDGGESRLEQPSTVIDARDLQPKLVREGAIAWSAIQDTFQSLD